MPILFIYALPTYGCVCELINLNIRSKKTMTLHYNIAYCKAERESLIASVYL